MRSGVRAFHDEYASVLGTTTMSSKFLEQLKEDLIQEECKKRTGAGSFADNLRNCIGIGEIDHLESPESDKAAASKLDRLTDDFFSKIPLPPDPMKAALAKTKEEKEEIEKFEVIKEAVRERYQARLNMRKSEEARIQMAMRQVDEGTHPSFQKESKYTAYEPLSAPPLVESVAEPPLTEDEELEIAQMKLLETELELMRAELAAIEAQMDKDDAKVSSPS